MIGNTIRNLQWLVKMRRDDDESGGSSDSADQPEQEQVTIRRLGSPKQAEETADDDDETDSNGRDWGWPFWRSAAAFVTVISVLITLITLKSTIEQNRKQNELTQRGQVADRFTKAVDQLNSPSLGVRLGGIYSLKNIAIDSKNDDYGDSTGATLWAFAGQGSKDAPDCPSDMDVYTSDPATPAGWGYVKRTMPKDIELAVSVLAASSYEHRTTPQIKGFHGVFPDSQYNGLMQITKDYADRDIATRVTWSPPKCWRDINLHELDLHNWDLGGFELTDAIFDKSNLDGAVFDRARLHSTKFRDTDLRHAWFILANAYDADLSYARLQGAYLQGANLCGAHLNGAVLTGAHFSDPNWGPATLKGAWLGGADLRGTDLSGVDLSQVSYDADTKWPDGFTPPAVPKGPQRINCIPDPSWKHLGG